MTSEQALELAKLKVREAHGLVYEFVRNRGAAGHCNESLDALALAGLRLDKIDIRTTSDSSKEAK